MTLTLRKINFFCGFILLLLATAFATFNTKICRRRNGKFPSPGTLCKRYYECKNYVPVEKECPNGEHFNPVKQWCDWEDLYPCLERPKDRECLTENGKFPKPGTNCKMYYQCCNGKASTETCPNDSLFDPSKGNCEWSELYTCPESTKDRECLTENGRFLKPGTNCKSYYLCSNGKARTEICPDGSLFDPSKGNCEWSELYTCIESLSTTEKVSSTVTTFATSTPPAKTSTDPAVSESTTQHTTESNRITNSTHDPDFERTNSSILEISTQPTPTDGQTSKTSPVPQTITSKISTSVTTEISSTLEPKEISTTSEALTSESISTLQTSTEISIVSETTSAQESSTHTISKENKEGDFTEPAIFETTTEETFSPSTVEVSTSTELNFMCPEPNGYFPHPSDKHKFVGCVSNIAHVLTCPSGLVYVHRLRRCEHE